MRMLRTPSSRARRQASACSRAPEPSTRTSIARVYGRGRRSIGGSRPDLYRPMYSANLVRQLRECVEHVGQLVDSILVGAEIARIERILRLPVETLRLGDQASRIGRQVTR